jgi:hypothetical protein
MVGRELLVEVSIPAQLRQVHSGVLIESRMAYSLHPSPAPTKAEVGEAGRKGSGSSRRRRSLRFTDSPRPSRGAVGLWLGSVGCAGADGLRLGFGRQRTGGFREDRLA